MSSPDVVISYRPFDGHNGLKLDADRLEAYHEGQLIASTDHVASSIDELLDDPQRIIALLPTCHFSCLTPFVDLRFSLDLRDQLIEPDYAAGTITIDGKAFPWTAQLVHDPVFALGEELPDGVRTGFNRRSASGWAIHVPAHVSHGDRVLERRIASGIEQLVGDITSGRWEDLPQQRKADSVFSAEDAPWLRVPLPLMLAEYRSRTRNSDHDSIGATVPAEGSERRSGTLPAGMPE